MRASAAILSLVLAGVAQAQVLPPLPAYPEVTFGPENWDVTGAGSLAMPGWEALLMSDARLFARDGLVLGLQVDAAGKVLACSADGVAGKRGRLAKKLCKHALATGQFLPRPKIELAYRQASLAITVRSFKDRDGKWQLRLDDVIGLQGTVVAFPEGALPPVAEMLTNGEIAIASLYMDYPSRALREGIEADVSIHARFADDGRVQTCRPLRSSNTAWMAYATCNLVIRRARNRVQADGRREWVGMVRWRLAS